MAERFNRGKSWKIKISALACCAIVIGLLSGCGEGGFRSGGRRSAGAKTAAVETSGKAGSSQASTEEPGTNREKMPAMKERTVTDELGHEVKIPADVKRCSHRTWRILY